MSTQEQPKVHTGFRVTIAALLIGLGSLASTFQATAGSAGTVLSHVKLSDTSGGMEGEISGNSANLFGPCTTIGDLDGDGIEDLAVGSTWNNSPGEPTERLFILFMNTDGTVRTQRVIAEGMSGFTGDLNWDRFGTAFGKIGDLDDDGVPDLAVGAHADDEAGLNHGAVWILFLNTDGTVKAHQKITEGVGGFSGDLTEDGQWAHGLAAIDDLDGDGNAEIAVGAIDPAPGRTGSVWILFLGDDGTVKSHVEIREGMGGFTGDLDEEDRFGDGLGSVGDLDGDGHGDLLVGSYGDDDGDLDAGAVWILYLNANGTVDHHAKISDITLGGVLGAGDAFGEGLAEVGDLNCDGFTDIAAGAALDGPGNLGTMYVLFLRPDGSLVGYQRITEGEGGFTGDLDNNDYFSGGSVAGQLDLDDDGTMDLVVPAIGDDDGGDGLGAAYVLFLDRARPGACCFTDGTCQLLCADACLGAGAEFLGETIACDPQPCILPGACCLAMQCIASNSVTCADSTGTFLAGVPCEPDPCVASGISEPVDSRTFHLEVAPNPSSGTLRVEFDLPHEAEVEFTLFGTDGREVAAREQRHAGPGHHAWEWDIHAIGRRPLANGVYYVRARFGDTHLTRSWVLMR